MQGILLESYLAYLSGRTYVPLFILFLSSASTLLPRRLGFISWQLRVSKLYLGLHRRRLCLLQRQSDPCASPLDGIALWYVAPVSLSLSTNIIFHFITGPVAGDPFPPSSGGAPAVMVEYFKEVCPNPTIIDPDEIKDALRDASAANLMQAWIDKLERTKDRCVEIKAHTMQVFDFWCVFALAPPQSNLTWEEKAIWRCESVA